MKQHLGFTLIEMLLAVAIFAIVGLASTGVLTSVIDSNEISIEHSEQMEGLQRAMLTFERDIRQATKRKVRINGEAPVEFYIAHGNGLLDSDSQVLAMRKVGWINPMNLLPRTEVQSFGYRVVEGRLERIYYDFADPVVGAEFKYRTLLEGVKGIKFEFHDGKASTGRQFKWLETWTTKELPAAIAVTIELEDVGEIRRLFLLPSEAS
ncbi:type II secretion system minor pseudopilin GspJ [Catenovulum sp. SM1970]|uniref:type II secretion system minor pseudopilin GspJ n=1 Tax=Marinifaba aquimaris TaxID=2741323 RepID=UPI001572A971|nr:type II secretion system minor pseudopilin GspJ [Marinifaba aquimaris]NTS75841.1 type II secretion system minor pseudopilin GspJ [Marinifaba aquimaris]